MVYVAEGRLVAQRVEATAECQLVVVSPTLAISMASLSKHFCAFGCSSIGRRASLLHCLNKFDITDSALGFVYCPLFCRPERGMSCFCRKRAGSSRYFND